MADNKPINWAYPFKTAGENSQDVTNPQLYFDALAKAENGFYPLGANGLWHGGVHFDANTGALLDQSQVRCIADGEVIAYRIDDKYPETAYAATNQPGIGPEPAGSKYSTGFVLVKHRLVLPEPPAPTSTGETSGAEAAPASTTTTPATTTPAPAATSAEPEGLTLYSLYMHLLDCTGYQAQPALKRPAFWGAGLYKVKADAPDKVLGLNVREHYKVAETDEDYAKYQNKLTTLPRGTTIETGEAAPPPNQNWRKLVRATPAVAGLSENTGWVYVPEAKKLAENRYLVSEKESKDVPALEQLGLHVRETASGSSNVLAVLPRGTEIKVSPEGASGKYLKLESISSGNAVPPLTADAEGKLPGYVWLDSLESQQAPHPLAKDKVHILPQGHSIKAGELIGHLGVYQDYNQQTAKPRLHLEVFSCDDVPAFIEKSKARAETLPGAQKTLIKVEKGSKIIQPAAADAQIATGADVRICSDSPKAGGWAKVQQYAICNADKNTELGSFNNTQFTYPLSAAQKATLAARMGIDATEMPDHVDFLKVYFNSVEGGDPHDYSAGNIPTTHPWRKIGAAVGDPVWVERSKLNAQGQRNTTTGALAAWSAFPLHDGIDGQECGYERILPASSWDGLPDEQKATDPDNVQWWYVTVGDKNGKDISGWVPEKPLILTRHSPWEWPGFSTLQDNTALDAHLARTLDATGRTTEEEIQSYTALIDEAERGPIFSELYKVIDLPNAAGVRDNKLTPAELKKALGKPWLAQQLALLISQYESEWLWKEAKWNQLDKLMEHTQEDPNPSWAAEKKRIENLGWWSELAGQPGIAADGMAWHFQPIGITSNFSSKKTCCELNIEKFDSIFGSGKLFTARNMPTTCDSYNVDRQKFIDLLNSAFDKYEFKKCIYKTHFLAQCYHESDHFGTTMEYASGNDYDLSAHPATVCTPSTETSRTCKRHRQIMAEGNTTIGDGPKYKGKGLIQITWKSAYEKYKSYSGVDCVTNPQILCEDISHAVNVSFWFWTKFKGENLNSKIDRFYIELDREDMSEEDKDKEVVRRITKVVNGGDNHLHERQALFKKIKERLK